MRSPIVGGILVMAEMLAMVVLLYVSTRTTGSLSFALRVMALSLIVVGGWTTWRYSHSSSRNE